MSTNLFLEDGDKSQGVRPLAELPALRLVDSARDVRGWEIRGEDGRPLGTVVDILVDIDRLEANTVLVSLAGGDHGETGVVPLSRLAAEDRIHRRLTRGDGLAPIPLRYQSTTRFALWAAIVAAIVALASWIMGAFG